MNCKKLLCYLNDGALDAFYKLVAMGMDDELAFTLVETLGAEEVYSLEDHDIYSLEDDGGFNEPRQS